MKLTIPARDLAKVLANRTVVEKRNTIPILGNVLLRAQKNRLTARMTDLDIEVATGIACEVSKDGATTVPAHMIGEIIKKFTQDKAKADQPVTLELDGHHLIFKAGRSRYKLQTLPELDFPDIEFNNVLHRFEIPKADFLKLLQKARFCISTEETRYYLNGIFFHHHGNGKALTLRGVATDGHRLARIECASPDGADKFGNDDNKQGIIIPRKTCDLLEKIAEATSDDKIGLQLTNTKVAFEIGDVSVTSKLINGTFPDYARVVPEGNDKRIVGGRQDIMDAVDRLTTITFERGKVAKFALSTNKLVVSMVNHESGSATEEIDVDYTGDPLEIGFNSNYVVDVLGTVEGDKVEIKLADPGAPAVFTGVDKPDALFVLMPMRV